MVFHTLYEFSCSGGSYFKVGKKGKCHRGEQKNADFSILPEKLPIAPTLLSCHGSQDCVESLHQDVPVTGRVQVSLRFMVQGSAQTENCEVS